MKLVFFTDPHYSSQKETCTTRRPFLSYDKMREALCAMGECDMVLCMGDLINDCGDPAENRARLQEAAELLHSAPVPVYCVPGNHDYEAFTREEFQQISENLAPPAVLRIGDKTLLFPDSAYRADGVSYSGNHFEWTDSFLPEPEMNAVRQTLKDPETKEAYVFLHQNLDPDVEVHHIIRNAADVRELLAESGKVKMVVQGHYHPGHDNEIDGIRYLTLPAMCEGERNWFTILEI